MFMQILYGMIFADKFSLRATMIAPTSLKHELHKSFLIIIIIFIGKRSFVKVKSGYKDGSSVIYQPKKKNQKKKEYSKQLHYCTFNLLHIIFIFTNFFPSLIDYFVLFIFHFSGADKLSPSAFEKHSGREGTRKWKSNVWVMVKGEKVSLAKTVLLKYYNQASKNANGSHKGPNGRPCHRDEFIRCSRCTKERRFRLRTKEECRIYHDALADINWKCSDLASDK